MAVNPLLKYDIDSHCFCQLVSFIHQPSIFFISKSCFFSFTLPIPYVSLPLPFFMLKKGRRKSKEEKSKPVLQLHNTVSITYYYFSALYLSPSLLNIVPVDKTFPTTLFPQKSYIQLNKKKKKKKKKKPPWKDRPSLTKKK